MTIISFDQANGFSDVSEWLTKISNDKKAYVYAGWELIDDLRIGIDQFGGQNRLAVHELYELASQQLEWTIRTLQNYVSIARAFPPERRVHELGISHYKAVMGLPDGEQDELLDKAFSSGLTEENLRFEVRKLRDNFVTLKSNEIASNGHNNDRMSESSTTSDNDIEEYDEDAWQKEDTRYTVVDQWGIEQTIIVKQGEELSVVSVDPPKATAYNNHAISDDPDYDGDEWYTPAEYIEAARSVMGGIDLDPATCVAAQEVVKATTFYTKEDDSLRDDCGWHGRVWLNPPYSTTLIKAFVRKLISQYENGNVEAAVIITNNSSDTGWFHDLLARYPACFTRGRVSFWRPNREDFGTRQGQTIFYLGTDEQRFVDEFSAFGKVVKAL